VSEYLELLLPGEYYHIYNRAVGKEKLFLNHENYLFFLNKCAKYLPPICDPFCFCLLPNHFHWFLRIKELQDLEMAFPLNKRKQISLLDSQAVNDFLVGRISSLCNGYVKAFNKVFSRKGGLFIDPFKRKVVKKDGHFNSIVFYVHGNATHHGYCQKLEDWPYSSYHQIINDIGRTELPFKVCRKEVLNWFGGVENFKLYHKTHKF
jgi:REP element-mobilizing transposase RayT